jgi:hypothetical protein
MMLSMKGDLMKFHCRSSLFLSALMALTLCHDCLALPGDEDLLLEESHGLEAQFDTWNWGQGRKDRYLMLNDLIHSHKLIGKSRNEIHKLLGQPDPTNDYDNEGTSINSDTYPLNTTRCGNAAIRYLDITYRNARVTSVRSRIAELLYPTRYGKTITENPPRLAFFDDLPKLPRIKLTAANSERHPKEQRKD